MAWGMTVAAGGAHLFLAVHVCEALTEARNLSTPSANKSLNIYRYLV
jgi:hypothetical protein